MKSRNLGFVALTAADACEFFDRCFQTEALLPEERMAVLHELAQEKRILLAGTLDEKTSDALDKFTAKTKHKGVIAVTKNA